MEQTNGSRPLSVTEIQSEAKDSAQRFLSFANDTTDARDAANWTLAAKNAVSVAVSSETILKIQRGGR